MSDPDGLERARLHGVLERVVPGARTPVPATQLPQRLVASWQRSQEYGVSLEEVAPAFTGTLDQESLFFECGKEVLTDLHRTLTAELISLMLTDSDGLVLNRLCGDHSLMRALDASTSRPASATPSGRPAPPLGLALADRAPTLVRAEEHYSLSLCAYTCAAVPVLDPLTGRLEGSVNLTTWSTSSSGLLLALAESAASNTASLMLARSQGRRPRPAARGEVLRVEPARPQPGSGTLQEDLSGVWTQAVDAAHAGLVDGRVVAAVGEPGAGRTTLLAQAERRARRHERILAASTPATRDVEAWLALWTPELGKPHTAVVVRDVDAMPTWVAERLRDLVVRARAELRASTDAPLPFSVTAERFEDIPAPLASLVDVIVPVPPLRERPDDVVPLTRHAARRVRGRDIDLTPAAEHVLRDHPWPGNVEQLQRLVQQAARRSDVIDVRHLPAEALSAPSHRLTRIESLERDEIVRTLTQPGITMKDAAERLGIGRATLYRKLGHYGITLPRGH